MRAVAYFLNEAALSLWRRRRASGLAIATIAVALFVLGGFLLVSGNLQRLVDRWSAAAELSIYLAGGASDADRAAIERTLAGSDLVAAREFVSQEQALARFREQFPDLAAAAASLPANPLPASYEVRLAPGRARDEAVDRFADRLRASPGVADVRYDREWLDRLLAAVGLVRAVGFALAGILVLAAALTVMSVVRLALIARQGEIEIMQLVGAPLAWIRGPFVMEGVLQGGMGAAVAAAALWAGYLAARPRLTAWAEGLIASEDLTFVPWPMLLGLIAGGLLLGCAGGLVAARAAR